MFRLSLIGFLCSLVSFVVLADSEKEITHLLNFVATTSCQYERNGDIHTGSEAVEHIKKKYDYFREDIETTEDFIKYSATKSKISGSHYKIHCPNQATIHSSSWLIAELERYRNTLK